MLIILTLYIVLAWLIFSKLKLLKWGWVSGTVVALGPRLTPRQLPFRKTLTKRSFASVCPGLRPHSRKKQASLEC